MMIRQLKYEAMQEALVNYNSGSSEYQEVREEFEDCLRKAQSIIAGVTHMPHPGMKDCTY